MLLLENFTEQNKLPTIPDVNLEKNIEALVFHRILLIILENLTAEAAIQRCSYKKVFWKYAANLQENTHAKVWFQ